MASFRSVSLLVALCLCALAGHTQIAMDNAYLQGDFIRIGLSPNAAFGSNNTPPPGFIPPGADIRNSTCNRNRIGFVADKDRDGWNTGTPAFMGDYFVPGAPEEGWGVRFNGVNYNNNRNGDPGTGNDCVGGTQIPGAFSNYQLTATRVSVEWNGAVSVGLNPALQVKKRITLPVGKLYFIVETKLINISGSPMTDVFYMRNVDPDNEVAPTGQFQTRNNIVSQNPNTANKALVSAVGLTYGSYLGLGTIDCRARVCIGGEGLRNRNPELVHTGASPRISAEGAGNSADMPIALAFKTPALAAGDSVTFTFAYVLSADDLNEALAETAPQVSIAGQLYNTGDTASSCTGVPYPISIANGDNFDWTWSPATGLNTTTGSTVIHTPQPGPITYTATGVGNCTGTTQVIRVTIRPLPSVVANFTTSNDCNARTVTFTNTSSSLGDGSTTYAWDFGDGNTSTATSPSHTYATAGTYSVKLTATPTRAECLASVSKPVAVRVRPIGATTYNVDGCAGAAATFAGTGTVDGDVIAGYSWYMHDGTVYNTASIAHTYPAAGNYPVRMVVRSASGCTSDTVRTEAEIHSIPVASLQAVDGCVGLSQNFLDRSTNAAGAITTQLWNMGDGFTANTRDAVATYSTPGDKDVRLEVFTSFGCKDDITLTIDIETAPQALFEHTQACLGDEVRFTNLSTNAAGNIASYLWTFEGRPSTGATLPPVRYTTPGDRIVTLQASSENGCLSKVFSDTLRLSFVVASAGRDTLVFKTAPFQLSGSGGATYLWSPAANLNDPTLGRPTGTVDRDTEFEVIATNREGCFATDRVMVRVYRDVDIYIPSAFSPDGNGLNDRFRIVAPPSTVTYFEIFNRWGQKVWSTRDQNAAWDGRVAGQPAPAGAYVYVLKLTLFDGRVAERKGSFVLMR